MTGRDVPDADMPNTPRPHRADVPAGPDEALDALLAGGLLTAGTGPGLQPVAELLAALTAPPEAGELAGHARALAEFRATRQAAAQPARAPAGQQDAAPGGHRRRAARPRRRRSLLTTRAAAAVGALATVLGGVATAAYAGVLPGPVQQFAHDVIGAPAPHAGAAPGAGQTPSGSASSAQAASLCTAYTHGTPAQRAVAVRKLSAAAGGRGHIAAYCAAAAGTGTSPPAPGSGRATPGARGGGKPSPPGKPTAAPTPHSTGKQSPPARPTAAPTPHSTGKPSTGPGKPSAEPTPHAS
ncbi:MAG: hypothetical protein ACM32E_00460 [Gemmatimonadota bacterium]